LVSGFRVFENRASRGKFAPEREEVIGGWRKLHNEELQKLCSSPDIIREVNVINKIGKACGTHGS
jgi:hypothetical protein